MVGKVIQLTLFIALSFVFMMLSGSCGGCGNPEVCFTMKPYSCPGADFAGSTFHVSKSEERIQYINPLTNSIRPHRDAQHYVEIKQWVNVSRNGIYAVTENNTIKNKFIEGKEVNYGWWSKDSYRKYTYAEMFEWKYGRKPTPAELENITCAQVKSWFIERHTVERSWPLDDDPPYNVKCKTQPFTKYCTTLNGKTKIKGYIKFPDGTTCKIKQPDLEKDFNPCDNPHNVELEVEDNCNKCTEITF